MPHQTEPRVRVTSIDALRGAVMVIMALDHVRDFIHAGAMSFSPEDLAKTTPILFFTRWITHFCAPVFFFLAGLGASLRLARDGSTARLAHFLWTRGLWLILIELTLMRLAFNFTFAMRYPVILLILCALGLSMVVLALLIRLPTPALAALSVAIIALHNTLDGIRAANFGSFAPVWQLLHEQGVFTIGGAVFVVAYPVLPWIGVMAAGYCFGQVYRLAPASRQRILVITGTTAIVLFVLLRFVNVYGDPVPWSVQRSPVFTMLSFLRATKYPPSLDFILMTLGPALVMLAALDRWPVRREHPLAVIGRVPFFYYVVHFWLAHVVCSVLAWFRYGNASFAFLFDPVPSMGGPRELFPAGFGYPLWVVYVVWIGIVVVMYPLCRWFDDYKRRNKSGWTSYV